jgi:Holliday junction resolvase RusA-like endonuclease
MQYRAFADELRLRVGRCESVRRLVFYMPMPMSWSLNVRLQMNGTAHQHKPDLDNLVKAVFDALFEDDQFIWDLHATKVWSETGAIEIA